MRKSTLRATTALQALALLGLGAVAAPAYAQDATPTPAPATSTTSTTTASDDEGDKDTVVVTGSILRRTTTETPSPVTVVTAESLDQRGISTVQDGLQSLAANNGPALTNSFTANGAFAGGASAVSLRGLSTNSTLVLFDGLRASYYPLADDGSRNFVDLNTIPDDIVERVEVLRDGASSSYGADAIAGVVNIITKREFTGLSARGEAGISSRGDAASKRLGLTLGTGKLAEQGFNAYLSAFYYKSNLLRNRERPGVYGTDDLSSLCNDGTCGANGVVNGLEGGAFPDLHFGAYGPFLVRAAGTTRYQNLDVALGQATTPGCRGFSSYTLTAAEQAGNPVAPATVCQVDLTKEYGVIQPNVRRFGVSSRVTAALGDNAEAYFETNFLQSNVDYTGFLPTIRGNAPTGIYYKRFSTSTGAGAVAPGSAPLALPVYVCATGVGTANGLNTGCDATNGTLNPYNPYAAAGKTAQILGHLPDRTRNATRNRSIRAAGGVTGTFMTDVDYSVMGTLMHTDLRRSQKGYVFIQNFLNAVARGQYNFLNPSATSDEVMDLITPDNRTDASSDLYQLQGTATKPLMEMAGGPLQLGVGASIHYEKVDSPSANSDINGPTQRYFTLNAFGTSGSRVVKSAFAELDAPVLDILGVNLSARYDDYSSGQSAFSPKIGLKFTPIKQVALRGTLSKGFRIPSFGEANALPTTGYVTAGKGIYPDSYLAKYGCSQATYTKCPAYITGATYGLTTLASPNLDPEKSRSITLGAIVEPIRNWSATVDFYAIKKTGAIANPSTAPAIAAYYATGALSTDGVTVIPDAPDVNNPTVQPRIAFVESSLVNADTNIARGLDFGISGRHRFGSVKWTTSLDASYIMMLKTKFADGHVERYDGTLGNYNLTAGSGTPKFKGNWQNTLDFGMVSVTGTANYFGGYDFSAMDQGGDYKDCSLASGALGCRAKSYLTFDANASVKISDKFTVYGTVLNLFDNLPPYDDVTYGAHLYNPVQGGLGILGRYFKGGIKVNL